ncbi:MAG: hypothetical protein ACR2PA_25785 [Hyphomicrobiaceae bacterium]
MTLNFEETTPGVHMAMWEGTKSKAARTVVIIESLGQFTLYIDGDVTARDLDTFESAVARAHANLSSNHARRMVKIAGGLVIVAALGGTAIGLGHLLSSMSVAGVQTAIETTGQSIQSIVQPAQFTRFKPVKRQPDPVVINRTEEPVGQPINPVRTVSTPEKKVETKPVVSAIPEPTRSEQATVELVPTSATAKMQASNENPSTQQANETVATSSIAPQPDSGPRVFSATRPLNTFTKIESAARPIEREPENIPVATIAPSIKDPVTEAPVIIPNDTSTMATGATEPEIATQVADLPDPETIPLPQRNPQVRVETVAPGFAPITTSSISPYSPGDAPTAAESKNRAQKLYRKVTKSKQTKRKLKRAKKKSSKKKRVSRGRIKVRRSRRVMRCMYGGGCRLVTVGGYYDRQYRRRYR